MELESKVQVTIIETTKFIYISLYLALYTKFVYTIRVTLGNR